ncbi:MAG TPA: ATP-binding protein [Chloroflexota bacterium]|nr:ATP-binding protein [Chloroflexota bacterium]
MISDGREDSLGYLALAREVAAAAAHNADPDECLRILRAGLKHLGFSRVGIWLTNPKDPGTIRGTWGTGWHGEEVDEHHLRMPLGRFMASDEIVSGANLVLGRVNRPSDPRAPAHGAEIGDEGPSNWASAALRADGQLMGIISVDLILDDRTIDPHDASMVQLLADIVANALARAQAVRALTAEVVERRRAQEALAERERRFRLLIESTSDVYLLVDALGIIRYASESVERVFGYAPDEILGTPILDLIHPEDVAAASAGLDRALHGPRRLAIAERRYRNLDGDWRFCDVLAMNYLDEPAVRGLVVTLRDRTEQRQLEAQLRQAQKMEAVGRLAGGVAHDFNNLLTIIGGYASLLSGSFPNESREARAVRQIRRAADNAASLTRHLLAFSRRQFITPRDTNLNEVIAGATPMLGRLLGEDIAMRVDLAPDTGVVRVDPDQMVQVLINLAANARDAMPSGGTLTITTTNLILARGRSDRATSDPPGPQVCLSVTDSGIGMDETVLQHLFEPFFTTKEVGKGTGLGLAAVHGIVTQCGGTIEVVSGPGKGTVFKLCFPRRDGPATALDPVPDDDMPRGVETILVVEDESPLRALARSVLEYCGYRVFDAEGGTQALKLSASHDGPIDLLLADVVMPGLSGREVAELLVRQRPGLKVLYTSGYTDDVILQHGVSQASVAYLPKPFSPADLARAIRRQLDSPTR